MRYLMKKNVFCELNHWCGSVLSILIFFAVIALIVCGFMIIKPAAHALVFKPTECIVEETQSHGNVECQCGGFSNDDPYCESKFHTKGQKNI